MRNFTITLLTAAVAALTSSTEPKTKHCHCHDHGGVIKEFTVQVGCFMDQEDNRALPELLVQAGQWANGGADADLQDKIDQCAKIAREQDLRYFALQAPSTGTECWGSSDLRSAVQYGQDECGPQGDEMTNYVYETILALVNETDLQTPFEPELPKALGCYKNKGPDRTMDKLIVNAGDWAEGGKKATLDQKLLQCQAIAQQQGYSFFSLQYPNGGTECWAHYDFNMATTQGEAKCDEQGAGGKGQIYETIQPTQEVEVPGITELGCYNDNGSSRNMPNLLINAGDWQNGGSNASLREKITQCASFAKEKSYQYFGLQNPASGTECWASNDLKTAQQDGQADCGNQGGSGMNFVYDLSQTYKHKNNKHWMKYVPPPPKEKVPGVKEHGCYHDKGNRAFDKILVKPGEWNGGSNVSTEEKIRQCNSQAEQ